MRTRSEWFLNPGYRMASSMDSDPTLHVLRGSNNMSSSGNMGELCSVLRKSCISCMTVEIQNLEE